MKRIIAPLVLFIFTLVHPAFLSSQSNFNAAAYKSYLEANKNLATEQLLDGNPAPYTYYSSRIYRPDLNTIPWFDSIDNVLSLTGGEKDLLEENFFMVTRRNSDPSWTYTLIRLYNNDIPLFLSTDYILHTLHRSYDEILMTLEWQLLEPKLMELLNAMYAALPVLESKYVSDPRLAVNIDDVDLYISVARTLLYDTEYLPQSQSPQKFNEILGLVEAEDMAYPTLFTESRERKIDFSQFTPRGHYTRNFWVNGTERNLENYFRAMMWLGRIDFLLTPPPPNPWEDPWTEDELRRMQQSALLLNELLELSGKSSNLELHERIITRLVGPDDNLTPSELEGLSSGMLGSPADLFESENFHVFSDSLNASDDYGQKIMSNFFLVDPYSEDPGKLPVSFRLLGQKFLIDSYILSEVVFDRIVWNGDKIWRGLPDPLDVMSVLGNMDAMRLMEADMEQYKYAYKVDALKYLVDSYDPEFWEQSLYNNWLGAIRDLNPSDEAGLPYFMRTTAWHHKTLNTQLSSWAELRHDNILYAKQSYTGGTSCSFPYTYVEPYPEFFRGLESFADNSADFFEKLETGFESRDSIVSYYRGYSGLMHNLGGIAGKERAGTPLSDNEISFLKTMINSYMASGPSVKGWMIRLFFNKWDGLNEDYAVADVHTQPTEYGGEIVGKVLHVGNGNVNMGVFLAPNPSNPEQLMAFAGPVSSFHTRVTLNFDRLTDERWEEMFRYGQFPGRPDWVNAYMADEEGNVSTDGRHLKGDIFTGTFTDPASAMNQLDYLLAYPNPAGDEFHLRFLLNLKNPVRINIYSLDGREVMESFQGIFMPGEHDIPVSTAGWSPGVYLVKFSTGYETFSRKVLVR